MSVLGSQVFGQASIESCEGLLYKHRCNCNRKLLIPFLPPLYATAQTVRSSSSSYNIGYVANAKDILNPDGHCKLPHSIGSKVTAFVLNEGILPIEGVASGRVCNQWGYLV